MNPEVVEFMAKVEELKMLSFKRGAMENTNDQDSNCHHLTSKMTDIENEIYREISSLYYDKLGRGLK